MSFKGGLSLLLCLMLLLTSAFAFAEEPVTIATDSEPDEEIVCRHEHTTVNTVIGDGTATEPTVSAHMHVYTLHTYVTCSDCGALLEDNPEEKRETEPHAFDENGLCACGYACPHPEQSLEKAEEITGVIMTGPINEMEHRYENTVVIHAACRACGTKLNDVTEVRYTQEPHAFDENGLCVCGYQCPHIDGYENGVCRNCGSLCAHPNAVNGEEHEKIDHYVPDDFNAHSAFYDIVADRVCPDCGAVLEKDAFVRGGGSRREAHTFGEDGLCVCGQEPCKHDRTYHIDTTVNHVYAAVDEKYHTDTCDVLTQERCDLCRLTLSETIVEKGCVVKNTHNYWEDGVCLDCQYQSSCAHEHVATLRIYASQKDTCDYVDETYHCEYYDNYGTTCCLDCGKALEYDVFMQETTKLRMHHYDPDGICTSCGAKNACQHPGTRSESYSTGGYDPLDETYCVSTGNRVTMTYCTACGTLLKEEETPSDGVKEEHYFYGGKCSRCGYVPECAHEKTYIRSEQRYYATEVPKDDQVHLNYYNLYEVTLCAVCEKQLSEQLVEKNCEEPVAHSSGVLCSCGYINTCRHENVRTEYYDSDGSFATRIDDKTHYLEWDTGSFDVCADCGADLGNEQITGHTKIVQTHDYEDGVCCCGQVNSCKHASTFTETYWIETALRKLDSKYHMMLLNWYERVRCADCGEELSSKLIQTGDEERGEHYYNDVGVCRGCGYVNTACKHEHVSTELRWEEMTVVSKDADTHTFVREVSMVTVCADCGKVLTEEASATRKETEPHQDNGSGYCVLCDAAMGDKACAHTHTTEETYYRCQKVLAVDDSGHTMKAVKVTSVSCADCGYWLRDMEEPGQEVTEPHEYYLDRCLICDHRNPCKHGKTHTETSYSNIYDYAPAADGHSFKGCKMELVWCDVCESLIGDKILELDGTYTEEHFFENGVCAFCGYKAPAVPTPGPTAKPSNDTDNTFVPTPRPQAEPTVEPTATPAPQAMVDTLLGAVQEAEAEGSEVSIEVVGAAEIMTETEYTALKALPAQEQILVTLASIGFEDVVEAAMKAMNVTLSEDAQTLMTQVNERMAAVPEEERAALEEKLAQYFPVEEVEVDGVKTSYFVIDLRIEVDGVVRVERYGFRLDENGEWIFVKLDLQSVAW